nr:phytanoyl-CoA dioxygenase family protein [Pseudenhygromyxa sp. WMMC2535]
MAEPGAERGAGPGPGPDTAELVAKLAEGHLAQPPERAELLLAVIPEHGLAVADELLAALERADVAWTLRPAWIAARLHVDLLLGARERADARLAALERRSDVDAQLEVLAGERALLARARGDAKAVIVRTTRHEGLADRLLHRAWALEEIGVLPEAADLLERARQSQPHSIHLAVALALARHRLWPEDPGDALERRFESLQAWAPGLLSDAARVAGVDLWTDRGVISERGPLVRILEQAQALLERGDFTLGQPCWRASPEGSLRFSALVHAEPGESLFERFHAQDRERLAALEGALIRALGVNPPKPEGADAGSRGQRGARSEPWTPRTLSREQLERFYEDGFLVFEGAFDPDLARRWREDAIRRIRDAPERWVRGYDPADASASLRGFDPGDRSTWTWPRIELMGGESVRIAEFSPVGWGAILDLLGGPERVATTTWNDYLILNLCAQDHLDVAGPAPDWDSWHIDDPSPVTRLDTIRNGLVGIALFDDLLPRSGNTWLAPDSVPRVAQALAEHPEGIDFCNNRGAFITSKCERFHEVVGKTGDLLLMHPLMMHSSSPNASGRIRWMSNPMVYLREPLKPFRPAAERSPVEEAVARACGR